MCEGPIDAIRIDCAGRWAAVAPCGTALTKAQGEWIVALARANNVSVVVAFDGDAAGQTAAWKAWDLLTDLGAPGLRLADVPHGRDPADLRDGELGEALGQVGAAPGLQRGGPTA